MNTDDLRNFALGKPNAISSAIVAAQADASRENAFHARQDAARREQEFPGTAERVAARRAARNAERKF